MILVRKQKRRDKTRPVHPFTDIMLTCQKMVIKNVLAFYESMIKPRHFNKHHVTMRQGYR